MQKKSVFVENLSEKRLKCVLCPHNCIIKLGKRGKCRTRANENQELAILTWGRLAAVAVDPIEKKPFSHFRPGTLTFSVGTAGCNLVCPFCQNASLSQCPLDSSYDPAQVRQWQPEEVVTGALQADCSSISFTYSEPILSLEFAAQTSALARAAGLDITFVSNGQINPNATETLCNTVDATNIDLKSFSSKTYSNILGGQLSATLNTIETLLAHNVWVEITTLIVPGMNDSPRELTEIATFLANLSKDIPWHVSRFHPAFHQTQLPHTPTETIKLALKIGHNAGLNYVYAGNMPGKRGENTYCPNCKDVVVDRVGYSIVQINTVNSECLHCGHKISGVGFP